MEFEFKIGDHVEKVSVECKDAIYTVRHGSSIWNVEFESRPNNLLTFRIGTRMRRLYLVESEDKKYLSINGRQFCVERHETSRRRFMELDELAKTAAVCPPMPGMVVKINISEGDPVEKNQSLAVVEAMKMENELRSPMKGRIRKIHASAGDLVDAGKPIIELEAN